MDNNLKRAYNFFKESAGYIVGQRAQGALQLARAEQALHDSDFEVVWEWDQSPDLSWMTLAEMKEDHEVMVCRIVKPCPDHGVDCRHSETLAVLCGIVDANSDYERVIEAELALEVF